MTWFWQHLEALSVCNNSRNSIMNGTQSENNEVHKTVKPIQPATSLLNLICLSASIRKFYTEEANKQFSIISACKCEVRYIKTNVINNCVWPAMFLHAEYLCVAVCVNKRRTICEIHLDSLFPLCLTL